MKKNKTLSLLSAALFLSTIAGFLFKYRYFAPMPTIALTFDAYTTTYTDAFPIMQERGLVGTYYVDPDYVNRADQIVPELRTMAPSTDALKVMRAAGWSIQGYTGQNMVRYMQTEGPDITKRKLEGMKTLMERNGFQINSIAAGGRAWSPQLRELVRGTYTTVRANENFGRWQQYPIEDPLWIKDGATNSLSALDTPQSLVNQLEGVIQNGGLWMIVSHKVGADDDPGLSISKAVFSEFCDRLAKDANANRVRVATIEQAVKPITKIRYIGERYFQDASRFLRHQIKN